jgi:hypothetical protein
MTLGTVAMADPVARSNKAPRVAQKDQVTPNGYGVGGGGIPAEHVTLNLARTPAATHSPAVQKVREAATKPRTEPTP